MYHIIHRIRSMLNMTDTLFKKGFPVAKGEFKTGILQKLWDEMVEEYKANPSNAFVYQSKPREAQFNFIISNETNGSGCCGIIPIGNLRWLYPKVTQYATSSKDNTYDWEQFRKDIKDLFYGVFVVDKGSFPNSGKIFTASLTTGTIEQQPHLLEVLHFLGFEQRDLGFCNSTTKNRIVLFERVPKKALCEHDDYLAPFKTKKKSDEAPAEVKGE